MDGTIPVVNWLFQREHHVDSRSARERMVDICEEKKFTAQGQKKEF